MPTIGNKEHATGEAAAGTSGEEGLHFPDGKKPNSPGGDSYGQGEGGRGPELVTEGDSNRSTPLKGGKS